MINQLTLFIRVYRQSVITEERLKFIPTHWTMTTFSETHNLLKRCQLPLKIVCSLHLLQRVSKRLCGKPKENFGSNFAVFIALIYQEVLVNKTAQREHILIHASFAYFICAKWSIIVSFFAIVIFTMNVKLYRIIMKFSYYPAKSFYGWISEIIIYKRQNVQISFK